MTEPTIDEAIEVIKDGKLCRKPWDQQESDRIKAHDLAIRALEEMRDKQSPCRAQCVPRTWREVTLGEVAARYSDVSPTLCFENASYEWKVPIKTIRERIIAKPHSFPEPRLGRELPKEVP